MAIRRLEPHMECPLTPPGCSLSTRDLFTLQTLRCGWVKPLLSNPYGKAMSKIAWSFKKLVCSSWSAAQLTPLSAAYTLDGITYFCIRNITNTIIKTGSWLGMGTLWICLSLKCTITGLFSGCKFCVEVMLMCKYNLFVVIYKNGYRELFVSKEPVWGSTHGVYHARGGLCVVHEKKGNWIKQFFKTPLRFLQHPKAGAWSRDVPARIQCAQQKTRC